MLKGKWLFHVIILILSLGVIGNTGQKVMAQTTVSLHSETTCIFDFTYLEIPFSLKLPFHTRHNDFFARLFIAPYLVLNSPSNLASSSSSWNSLVYKRGWVFGIGLDIYFSPQKSRPRPKKRVKIKFF